MIDKPIIILSQPKSGTYLASEILAQMGFEQTYMHLSEDVYSQYDKDNILDGRLHPNKYLVKQPLGVSSTRVKPNSFCVGHLNCRTQTKKLLDGFFKIVLTRDENERKKSWERFYNGQIRKKTSFELGRKKGSNVLKWTAEPDTYIIDFHDMINKNTKVFDQLQILLYGEVMHDSLEILQKSLDAETLTKSNKRA
jgi:hypothetical protein